MAIKFGSVKGYYFLDAWVMANIIQLATFKFCKRFLGKDNDPCGRMYDQMTQSARSCTANIAEGTSRHQTSRETELKLLDVARATLSELLGDYFFWSMEEGYEIWSNKSEQFAWVANHKLNRPEYTDDWTREAQQHISTEYESLAPAIEHEDLAVVINSLIILCNRTISMIEHLMQSRFDEFKEEGGFAENLTKERLSALSEQHAAKGAPKCPICGKKMILRTAQRGKNSGCQFWSCIDYPNCNGSLSYNPSKVPYS